jgi:hypothetical protein
MTAIALFGERAQFSDGTGSGRTIAPDPSLGLGLRRCALRTPGNTEGRTVAVPAPYPTAINWGDWRFRLEHGPTP